MNIYKKLQTISINTFLGILLFGLGNISAGLRDFKQDFDENKVTVKDNEHTSKKQDKDQKTLAKAEGNQSVVPEAPKGELKKFYDDFKPQEDKNGSSSTDDNTYNYYYSDYTPDYYRYHYPYNYPYYRFYPYETVINQEYAHNREQLKGRIKYVKDREPERHTWYNASLDSQYVSDNLSSIGMVISIVSAGKVNKTSYGFKFDYELFTETDGKDHYSIPLYHIGLVTGKQIGKGLVESFIAYSRLDELRGMSLKLSATRWIQKYIFISCGIGSSVINKSPLTDMHAGVGIGGSVLQLVISYRSQNSVNYSLKGPKLRLGITF